jgi:RNA polymerase sigma-70 factor (ECF subfamily)
VLLVRGLKLLTKGGNFKMFIFSTLFVAEISDENKAYVCNAERAFKEYADLVYRLAFLRTGNTADADDIMSDVFLRLVRNVHKIKSDEHQKAWLIRATINRCNSFFKKVKQINEVRITDVDATYEMSENSVLPLVFDLPPYQRDVVYMYYFEGYSVEEIAKLCGIATGTVKSRLSRARNELKNALKGEL